MGSTKHDVPIATKRGEISEVALGTPSNVECLNLALYEANIKDHCPMMLRPINVFDGSSKEGELVAACLLGHNSVVEVPSLAHGLIITKYTEKGEEYAFYEQDSFRFID